MKKKNKEPNQHQKCWFERNLWWIAVFIGLFIMRMCSELSK